MTTPTSTQPGELPTTIRTFLAAHSARDRDAALATFTPTAVVVDDGHTFEGSDEIAAFLSDAGAEFSYTNELVGAERTDEAHWVTVHRLEGDFPGGVAELRYRFTLAGGLIAALVIAP
jgi:ketosteroid isomerase-like protein